MPCHHLVPVDEKLREKRNKAEEKKHKEEKEQETDSNFRRYRPVDCGYWNDDHDGPFLYQPEMKRMKI